MSVTPLHRLLPPVAALALTLTAAPAAAAPVDRVEGYGKLTGAQREVARKALDSIACYHGCKGSVARCLAAKPRAGTAWRMARYIVFLARHGLNPGAIAKVLELRRASVKPDKVHPIKPGLSPRCGDPRSPLTIVEYADFQCPHCSRVSPLLQKLVKARKGKVVLYFKVYPLRFKGPSLVGARAALAAHRQGKFWQMAEALFKDPDGHTETGVAKMARAIGLDMGRFHAAMKDVNLLKELEANKIEGMRLGIKGTPALYFNGKPHLLRKDAYHLRDRIAEELELLGR